MVDDDLDTRFLELSTFVMNIFVAAYGIEKLRESPPFGEPTVESQVAAIELNDGTDFSFQSMERLLDIFGCFSEGMDSVIARPFLAPDPADEYDSRPLDLAKFWGEAYVRFEERGEFFNKFADSLELAARRFGKSPVCYCGQYAASANEWCWMYFLRVTERLERDGFPVQGLCIAGGVKYEFDRYRFFSSLWNLERNHVPFTPTNEEIRELFYLLMQEWNHGPVIYEDQDAVVDRTIDGKSACDSIREEAAKLMAMLEAKPAEATKPAGVRTHPEVAVPSVMHMCLDALGNACHAIGWPTPIEIPVFASEGPALIVIRYPMTPIFKESCEYENFTEELVFKHKDAVVEALQQWIAKLPERVAEHQPILKSKGRPSRKGRKGSGSTANQQMLEMLLKRPDSAGWNLRQWKENIGYARSTICETDAWEMLESARLKANAEKMKDRRRKPKGSDLNRS